MKKIYLTLFIAFLAGHLMAQSSFSTSSQNSTKHSSTTVVVKNDEGNSVKVKTINDLEAFTAILTEINDLKNNTTSTSRSVSNSNDSKLADAYVRYEELLKTELKRKGLNKEDKAIIESELENFK